MTASAVFLRLVVASVWLAGLLAPLAAGAQPLLTHAEAGRAFDALRASHPDTMPRLAEAESSAVLRTLADAPRFLAADRFAPADLGALSDLCDRTRNATTAYIAFGAMQQGQLVPDVMARNALAWQDEIALLQGFTARCIALQVPLAETLVKQMGEAQASRLRLGGIERSQFALLQIYVVAAGNCPIEAPESSSYCGVLDVMAGLAPVHARALPMASRATVRGLLAPLLARAAGEQRRSLQQILDAMGSPRCTGLCLLQPS
ncbi:hypothetical protein [Variovorax sp. PAMC 28711]|uniref:hypothetical protein n=1 Tax=Variovorax sp. PAMC 28711 TaxID=1795631 RepID=UPI00078E732F|nr:hypothetical protein [Variovorax sp. PAMC 28711]AMM26302.1 hypothetical protein AX767_19540 [Variovorax sp. PAMC 28711]